MMGLGLVYPIGAVLQGWIANHVWVRAVTVAGAVALLAVLVGLSLVWPGTFTAMGDPDRGLGPAGPLSVAPLGPPLLDPLAEEPP